MPRAALLASVAFASLAFLGLLGAVGARVGGANVGRATIRVTFWGALAMALTAAIGLLLITKDGAAAAPRSTPHDAKECSHDHG